ncbi:hypothetical protein, partial [Thiolapillus sp.]|uniref:hypothetical protein n=1 Tax=Thiolapillus sp. TaxID=2017437 RepID=UPI003AF6AC2D
LKDIASDKRMEQITWLEQLFQKLRYGAVVVVLGAKVFTSVPKQLLGLYNTAIDLKSVGGSSGALLKAFAELIRSPGQVVRGIRGESPVMLSRIDTYDREIAEALSYMEGENPRLIRWNEAVMLPIRVMQFYVVDIPSYITAKALAIKNGNSEQDAITYAEAFVTRTQGSGEARDLAFIMRRQRNVMLRTLTMFMTPMISILNQARMYGSKRTAAGYLQLMLVTMAPAVTAELIRQLWEDDEDDEDSDILSTFGRVVSDGTLSLFPLGNIVNAAIQGQSRSTPVIGEIQHGVMSLSRLSSSFWDEEAEVSKRDVIGVLKFAAVLTQVGGADQALDTASGLYDAIQEWDDLTKKEVASKIMFGR